MTTHTDNQTGNQARGLRANLRAGLGTSLGSGLLGGLCCIAAATTTAAGLGAAGFFTALMGRYQVYFILGSLAVMVFWLVRDLRHRGYLAAGHYLAVVRTGRQARPCDGCRLRRDAGHRGGCRRAGHEVTRVRSWLEREGPDAG